MCSKAFKNRKSGYTGPELGVGGGASPMSSLLDSRYFSIADHLGMISSTALQVR